MSTVFARGPMSSPELPSPADVLRERVADAIAVCEGLTQDSVIAVVEAVTKDTVESLENGGKVLLCGNGGSSADAQHLAAELIGRFCLDRRPLPAIALSDNVAAITAIGNDYSYEDVFVRGVQAFGQSGDVLIGLSTSGASKNVVAAIEAANAIGLITVAFVASSDCAMAGLATHVVCVKGANTARIQEGHMLVGHTIFELIERELCLPS
jgi:D-sedoheptulose 7-phosphate isomerase